jgi:hypothetical protein
MSLLSTLSKLFPDTDGPWHNRIDVQAFPTVSRPIVRILDFSQKAFTRPPFGTFGHLLGELVQETEDHMPGAKTIVIVFDQELTADFIIGDKGSYSVPKTNFDLNVNPIASWAKWLDINCKTDPSSVIKDLHNMQGKKTNQLPYEATICPPNWSSFMRNMHFWQFVNYYLAEGLYKKCKVPPGKQLIVMGPVGWLRGREADQSIDPAAVFRTPYQDAALATVWLTEYYQKTHDVIIFSNQDKALMAHLLAQPKRIAQMDLYNLHFHGLVAVAREWTRCTLPYQFIDIGKLFVTITRHAKNIPNVNFSSPVATWIFLIMFFSESGKSFLPLTQLLFVLKMFVVNIEKLELPLVQNVISEIDFRVNCNTLVHFIFLCYNSRFADLGLDFNALGECFSKITALLGSEKNEFCLSKIKTRLANTFWLFRCMIAAQSGDRVPDPTSRIGKQSCYGYEKESEDPLTGRIRFKLAEDVLLTNIDFPARTKQRSRDSSPKRQSKFN